jgi:hypothetical protein
MLYSSHGDGIAVWKIAADGSLEALDRVETVPVNKLSVTADGTSLLALSGDGMYRMKIYPATYMLTEPARVAAVSKPASMVML